MGWANYLFLNWLYRRISNEPSPVPLPAAARESPWPALPHHVLDATSQNTSPEGSGNCVFGRCFLIFGRCWNFQCPRFLKIFRTTWNITNPNFMHYVCFSGKSLKNNVNVFFWSPPKQVIWWPLANDMSPDKNWFARMTCPFSNGSYLLGLSYLIFLMQIASFFSMNTLLHLQNPSLFPTLQIC